MAKSSEKMPELPYVDFLLRNLRDGDESIKAAFGKHLHWGYWDEPHTAQGSHSDYGAAAERMARKMCDAAGIRSGMRVLDCGCGIGGTIASLNERFSDMELVGINIDERQLDVARDAITPANGNQITFLHGNACDLPFNDQSFNAVIAVECIFHFPSRLRFLREAHRVLKPHGQLGISDFVPRVHALPIQVYFAALGSVSYFGSQNPVPAFMASYRAMSQIVGFDFAKEDITSHTLPTYDVLLQRGVATSDDAFRASKALRDLSCRGLLRYVIFSLSRR